MSDTDSKKGVQFSFSDNNFVNVVFPTPTLPASPINEGFVFCLSNNFYTTKLNTRNLQSYIMVSKQKVLFVCTRNSCRSKIAEGMLNILAANYFKVYSAGSHPSRVHPNAISIMKEINIDISNHTSNSIVEYLNTGIDIVITVCDDAKLACLIFPKKP